MPRTTAKSRAASRARSPVSMRGAARRGQGDPHPVEQVEAERDPAEEDDGAAREEAAPPRDGEGPRDQDGGAEAHDRDRARVEAADQQTHAGSRPIPAQEHGCRVEPDPEGDEGERPHPGKPGDPTAHALALEPHPIPRAKSNEYQNSRSSPGSHRARAAGPRMRFQCVRRAAATRRGRAREKIISMRRVQPWGTSL